MTKKRNRLTALILALALMLAAAGAAAEQGALAKGDKGNEVARLQKRLQLVRLLDGTADGDYGGNTEKAVAAFETYLRENGHPDISPDGAADAQTLGLLYDDAVAGQLAKLSVGDKGSAVARMQERLVEIGLLSGSADGSYGEMTASAVRAFQQKMADRGVSGAEVTGTADILTLTTLFDNLEAVGIAPPAAYDAARPDLLEAAHLNAVSAILVDADTGKVLFEKDADAKRYPASTTKIMTAVLAITYGHLNDKITVPAVADSVPSDSSRVPVYPKEQMTMRDLLYGLMIRSGNDAAVALGELISGSVDAFVEAMNKKAEKLGMTNTHYVNPHGYHNADHYTTARDMARLTRYALTSKTFRTVVSTYYYEMPPTNRRGLLAISNTYAILDRASKYFYEGAFGIKTGFTNSAGTCYVGAATRNGHTLIAVTMRCNSRAEAFSDCAKLYNYGFAKVLE